MPREPSALLVCLLCGSPPANRRVFLGVVSRPASSFVCLFFARHLGFPGARRKCPANRRASACSSNRRASSFVCLFGSGIVGFPAFVAHARRIAGPFVPRPPGSTPGESPGLSAPGESPGLLCPGRPGRRPANRRIFSTTGESLRLFICLLCPAARIDARRIAGPRFFWPAELHDLARHHDLAPQVRPRAQL